MELYVYKIAVTVYPEDGSDGDGGDGDGEL